MKCPKCRNERFFSKHRDKIRCEWCGNLINYPPIDKEAKEEFVNVWETVQ